MRNGHIESADGPKPGGRTPWAATFNLYIGLSDLAWLCSMPSGAVFAQNGCLGSSWWWIGDGTAEEGFLRRQTRIV